MGPPATCAWSPCYGHSSQCGRPLPRDARRGNQPRGAYPKCFSTPYIGRRRCSAGIQSVRTSRHANAFVGPVFPQSKAHRGRAPRSQVWPMPCLCGALGCPQDRRARFCPSAIGRRADAKWQRPVRAICRSHRRALTGWPGSGRWAPVRSLAKPVCSRPFARSFESAAKDRRPRATARQGN